MNVLKIVTMCVTIYSITSLTSCPAVSKTIGIEEIDREEIKLYSQNYWYFLGYENLQYMGTYPASMWFRPFKAGIINLLW